MGLSAFTVDYWPPAPALAGLVSGYHRYTLDVAPGERHADVFFPAWANLRVKLGGEPWRVTIAGETFAADGAALFGPTSHALFSDSGGGVAIGAGLTPLGWSRLTRVAAESYADRIVPLAELLDGVGPLVTALAEAREPAPILDAWLLARLRPRRRDEARIVAIHDFLAGGSSTSVGAAAARFGLSPRRFNDLSHQVFGFGPKLLLRRARFLASLMELAKPSPLPDSARIASGYHDHSHFIRDAQEFLGMTPRAFLAMRRPLNAASMQKRTEVLGAPAQALLRPQAAA